MKRKMLVVLTLAVGLVVIAGPMFAHHSGAGIYDRDHPVTVSGTVTEYVFINPHVQIHFDVKAEDGANPPNSQTQNLCVRLVVVRTVAEYAHAR